MSADHEQRHAEHRQTTEAETSELRAALNDARDRLAACAVIEQRVEHMAQEQQRQQQREAGAARELERLQREAAQATAAAETERDRAAKLERDSHALQQRVEAVPVLQRKIERCGRERRD